MPAGGRYLAPDFGAAFAWGGVYVGLYGGYGWGSSDWSGTAVTGSASPGGSLFGGTIGFNIQNGAFVDRKSTRLNSSHLGISYAVFCLKKKKKQKEIRHKMKCEISEPPTRTNTKIRGRTT